MKVSVIGGGTGSSAVINGLKSYPDIDIDVIVGMADDGGSNAVLRDEFGLLPLSDIRKSIIALSTLENSDILRSLFTYRFSEGTGLTGHTLGNLIMTALSRISNSERKAVQEMCDIFQVRGRVLPITYENYVISAEYDNGMIIHGEHLIDEPSIPERTHIKRFWAEPKVSADAEALGSLENADMIIIGPGDIYTTILATMIPENVYQILRNAQGKIVYITNIMSKIGQTRYLTQSQIVSILEGYIGRSFDHIIVNTETIPKHIIQYYHQSGEHLLKDDLGEDERIIRKEIIADEIFKKDDGDVLVRSMVRHDADMLGGVLYKLLSQVILG